MPQATYTTSPMASRITNHYPCRAGTVRCNHTGDNKDAGTDIAPIAGCVSPNGESTVCRL